MTKDSNDQKYDYDFGSFLGGFWTTEFVSFEDSVPTSDLEIRSEFHRGEAELWPAGDKPEMSLLFDDADNKIVGEYQLQSLENLFDELGGDSTENYLRIRHAMWQLKTGHCALPLHAPAAFPLHSFVGTDLGEIEARAAREMVRRFGGHQWGGTTAEPRTVLERLREDPEWKTETVSFGHKFALLIWPEPPRFPEPKQDGK